MTYVAASRTPRAAYALVGLVVFLFLTQTGAFIATAIADSGGGAPSSSVTPDTASDVVAATAAEFRVDESGAATYSIPLYGVPGTAGVMPKLALSYSSQGGYGPVGKGWSISGLSAISRCRSTREAGDFLGAATPDGNPAPVNFNGSTDKLCLDGQRLILVSNSPACPAVSGMTAYQYRTEIESFQRVCSYAPTGGTSGVAFFTVERKDGSTSWYGDRVVSSTQNLAYKGYVNSTTPGKEGFALSWLQTRFQDSTGNYIDFVFTEPTAGEHLISEVRYTGKIVLSGQSGSAFSPYAKLMFTYSARAAADVGKGYVSGGLVSQSRRLDSITACASAASGCAAANQARYYQLTYANAVSGSGLQLLDSVQECRDSSKTVCMPATSFDWSTARYEFATVEKPANLPISTSAFVSYKTADVNGDGRQDFVYLRDGSSTCSTNWLVVGLGSLDAQGRTTFDFGTGSSLCLPAKISTRGEGAWHLLDYDGDGRDDLFVSGPTGQGWRLLPSTGSGFNASQNLIASIPVPSVAGKNDQVQLADLNGDGLIDIVYPSSSALRARLMTRSGSSFIWGAERTVSVDATTLPAFSDSRCSQQGYHCFRHIAGAPSPETGFVQLADFNGDAASDLLLQVEEEVFWYEECQCLPGQPCYEPLSVGGVSGEEVELTTYREDASETAPIQPAACGEHSVYSYKQHEMTVRSITATKITVGSYAWQSGMPHAINLADANGDGLTDLFYRQTSGSAWAYRINTGSGLGSSVTLPASSYEDYTRFADADGDGRADVLQVVNVGAYKAYYAHFAQPAGGYSALTPLLGGNAKICEGSGCDQRLKAPAFSDFDGDGVLDFMSIKLGDNADMFVSRPNQKFVPRDTIVRFTNGLGAKTEVVYAPLTNSAIYRRASGTRNSTNMGRGSPTLDFLAPTYVVAKASSSSPLHTNVNAMAALYYRYANAKVQGGGRGFLGFGEIVTVDPNQSGGYVSTQTIYAQGFPFTGTPVQTIKRMATGTYAVPTCLTQTITNACFAVPGAAFSNPGGSMFSDAAQDWQSDTENAGTTVTAYNPAVQAPVHVRPMESDEVLRDPFTGVQTSEVLTSFTYGAYGNVVGTQVDTITGASTLTSTVITANSYSDNASKWLLGRLTGSMVTYRRPNRSDVVRTTAFSYDATTGLMMSEQVLPGGGASLDLRKQYTLDSYGNRTRVRTCADPATESACMVAGVPLHPATSTFVLRQSRAVYDGRGRFPLRTLELFSNSTGTAPVELVVQEVVSRNLFGDVTQSYDLNGLDTFAVAGTFGRPYYTWAETVPGSVPGSTGGVESRTTYQWCGSGGVDCPAGAKFRQTVTGTAAPTQWTYFDMLGRPIMAAGQTFNIGVSGKDASAVCTRYDITGKPSAVSNPFFLPGTASAGPTGTSGVCNAASSNWTTTSYDVLGRPIQVVAPHVGGTSTATTAYAGLTTTITDPRGNSTAHTRNGLGELTKVVDANGLETTYWYLADGSNYLVRRNAGRGNIDHGFLFDGLGRKVRHNDPDAGITDFGYNALGELIWQRDADGNRIENELDVRGRVWRRAVLRPGDVVESTSTFVFDTATNGVGQLASESIIGQYAGWAGQANTALNFIRSYGYDSLGRPLATTTQIDGVNYSENVAYDSLGRVWRRMDASARHAESEYNARGFAREVCEYDASDGSAVCSANANNYLTVLETDAWGHTIRERRGNSAAMDVMRDYWDETGKTAAICAGNLGTCNLLDESYAWDGAGNLLAQQKEDRYLEEFSYDSLNRLTQSKLTMQDNVTVNKVLETFSYDALGNICRRTSLGWNARLYIYAGRAGCGLGDAMNSVYGGGGTGVVGPHQVSDLLNGTDHLFHYYDGRGNMNLRDAASASSDRTALYTADNKLHQVNTGTAQARFWYGSDGQRYKQEESGRKTLYLGSVEIVVEGSVTTTRRTVAGVMLQKIVGGTATNHYLFHNQLGSLARITNASGTSVEQLDYMNFGGRRDTATQYAGAPQPALTPRGYTGHEMLDGHSLIHMNGRVYDAYQGRFIQPDPIVQDPSSAQSWNAYTYVLNNPHRYTDSTGLGIDLWATVDPGLFFHQHVGKYWIRSAMRALGPEATGVAIGVGCGLAGPWGILCAGGATYDATRAFGGSSSQARKSGLNAAFSAAVFYGIGESFEVRADSAGTSGTVGTTGLTWGEYGAKVLAHGVAGGVMSELQGGSFGNGFAAAGFTEAFAPQIGSIGNPAAEIAVAAILGGTVSEMTGGKFANGAATAAFSYAFNELLHYTPTEDGISIRSPGDYDGAGDAFRVIPGVAALECAFDGCSAGGWTMAGLSVAPGLGRVGGAFSGVVFRSLTRSNFRYNLAVLSGGTPYGAHAHHVFPLKFRSQFQQAGINVNDPRFGAWWGARSHLSNARQYNAQWQQFLATNPSTSQMLAFGRQISRQYGISTYF